MIDWTSQVTMATYRYLAISKGQRQSTTVVENNLYTVLRQKFPDSIPDVLVLPEDTQYRVILSLEHDGVNEVLETAIYVNVTDDVIGDLPKSEYDAIVAAEYAAGYFDDMDALWEYLRRAYNITSADVSDELVNSMIIVNGYTPGLATGKLRALYKDIPEYAEQLEELISEHKFNTVPRLTGLLMFLDLLDQPLSDPDDELARRMHLFSMYYTTMLIKPMWSLSSAQLIQKTRAGASFPHWKERITDVSKMTSEELRLMMVATDMANLKNQGRSVELTPDQNNRLNTLIDDLNAVIARFSFWVDDVATATTTQESK